MGVGGSGGAQRKGGGKPPGSLSGILAFVLHALHPLPKCGGYLPRPSYYGETDRKLILWSWGIPQNGHFVIYVATENIFRDEKYNQNTYVCEVDSMNFGIVAKPSEVI